MGGHSHWAGIKHKKAITDAKKGKLYTKIIREIAIAAREGGGDAARNPRLRKAMDDARSANMPNDNVERAVLRGLGKLPGIIIEEVVFEGYGVDGVAVMVEATTDNKNRTTSEIRRLFSSHGGNLGSTGCVGWIFQQRGYFEIEKSATTEDKLYEIALEAGADDVKSDEMDVFKVTCDPSSYEKICQALESEKIAVVSSELTLLPTTEVNLIGDSANKVLNMVEALEEHDDVKNVFANYNVPDEILASHQ